MIIKNASVFQEDGTFKTQDIYIEGDKIAENGSGDVLDADGLIAIPGLTDIHFHGCMRNDFCDGTTEAIQALADYELSVGVTTICPATMTFSEEILSGIMKAAASFENKTGAELVGINMEGPFISPAKKVLRTASTSTTRMSACSAVSRRSPADSSNSVTLLRSRMVPWSSSTS